MSRIFAIGDVHGCNATLQQLLLTLSIKKEDTLYFLGDYIDRGPDSKGVIDTILDLRSKGFKMLTIRGNHEQLFMDSDDSPEEHQVWVRNGGNTAQKSFGIRKYKRLGNEYKAFFEETQLYCQLEDHILVHAGLNFDFKDPMQDTIAMLWSRETCAPIKSKIGGRILVHGHTPIKLDTILKQSLEKGRINIDGGCVFGSRGDGYGYLVAFELNRNHFYYTPCIDIV